MDTYNTWEKLSNEKFSQMPITKEEIMNAIRQESQSTITELKKRLKHKISWIIFFMCANFLWMALNTQETELLLILGIFLSYGLLYLIPIGLQYLRMNQRVPFSKDTLSFSKMNYALINDALRVELLVGLVTSPWPVIGGILLSNYYLGHSMQYAFHNPALIIVGLVGLFISAPFIFFAGRKANDIVYGEYIKELRENILKMESL